ncbi:hypothetical protein TNCT_639931 [Trichonephila clavata]|uniref:Uncharacterized protein n=1 Tax=Trichonephila clavata TaxID=2740835 RepID=A0A8X6LT90_TRICU|nr:hypothetical protein TNCT_639931 [Trichonephila clavata]
MLPENYPKRRDESEYYSKRKKPFIKDPLSGAERYTRDNKGNQLYPNSEKTFARNKHNEEYYARDFQVKRIVSISTWKICNNTG